MKFCISFYFSIITSIALPYIQAKLIEKSFAAINHLLASGKIHIQSPAFNLVFLTSIRAFPLPKNDIYLVILFMEMNRLDNCLCKSMIHIDCSFYQR